MTKKLADSNTSPKTYWTILNHLLYNKKLPIPPLLVDGKLVSDFYKKANIFNNFFASICTSIDNTCCLMSFSYRTRSRIKYFHVTENDILAIIKTLDPNKAHGCNNISIKIIKICSQSLTLPLKIIFKHSLKKGKFPKIWKKANVVPPHKREDKMLVKIIALLVYFLFLEKCLKELYIIPFSTIFKVIDFSHLPNLVFFQEIHVLPNYYQ